MALDAERSTGFPKRELTRFIYSNLTPDIPIERHEFIRSKALQIPELNYHPNMHYETREQLLTRCIKQSVALRDLCVKEGFSDSERRSLMGLLDEMTCANLHYDFFKTSFELQASEEQKAKYLKKIDSMEIVGCYAQTELGHGSNVRGLETTATYDPSFDGFVMHSPTLSSVKWWIGALGVNANYAIVVAQLISKGTNYGPHPFFVQIRDMKTHEPLPGVVVGDIGPKMGLNGNDNGFLKLEYLRIPREMMLTRFARVNQGGDYELIDPNAIKILYSSLVRARTAIIRDVWYPLAQALTIAIRYSLVRRQFPDPENKAEEIPILNYQIQQYKLFTSMSLLFGLIFGGRTLHTMFNETMEKLNQGDDGMLSPLHALVSLYKGLTSERCVEALELVRRSCGGHGFLTASALPGLVAKTIPMCTYDGDNHILMLQTAKYIIKLIETNSNPGGRFAVLFDQPPTLSNFADAANKDFQTAAFRVVAHAYAHRLFEQYSALKSRQVSKEVIWNDHLQIDGVKTATAFFGYSLHCDYLEGLDGCPNQEIAEIIHSLREVYALTELSKYQAVLTRHGAKCLAGMSAALTDNLAKIRTQALNVIEAFEIDDQTLNSVLGRKDGKVYSHMIWQAKYLNPVNKHKVFPPIRQYMRPKL